MKRMGELASQSKGFRDIPEAHSLVNSQERKSQDILKQWYNLKGCSRLSQETEAPRERGLQAEETADDKRGNLNGCEDM